MGAKLRPEDIPYILLGPVAELLPESVALRLNILVVAGNHLKAFREMVGILLSGKEEAEREHRREQQIA